MNNEKDVNKIIKSKVRKYKIRLLFESFFPLASGRIHSIPDVAGPLKLILDGFTIGIIAFIILTGIPISEIAFTLVLPILSAAVTIGLYKIDYDPSVISKIEKDVLESLSSVKLDNEEILEKQMIKSNKDNKSSPTITNNTFDNNFEPNNFNNGNGPKVLAKRK